MINSMKTGNQGCVGKRDLDFSQFYPGLRSDVRSGKKIACTKEEVGSIIYILTEILFKASIKTTKR